MLRVGLTGGIGCGKSVVAQHFAARNVPIIDADQLAHRLTAHGSPVLDTLANTFGAEVRKPNGDLDRAWLRKRIFSDARERQKLEAILHPQILDAMRAQLQAFDEAPYVLLVVPLLLETPAFLTLVDRVLVVDCTSEQQYTRVSARDGLNTEQIQAILAAQMSRETRLARADDVLTNTGDETELQARITDLHRHYLTLSANKL